MNNLFSWIIILIWGCPVDSSFTSDNEAGPAQEEGEEGEEEDVCSLQIAWEVLELARVIYSRQVSPEAQRKLAKVKIKLGEVSYHPLFNISTFLLRTRFSGLQLIGCMFLVW